MFIRYSPVIARSTCMQNLLSDLENEGLVEYWVQCFAMNFGLHLFLLVWHDVNLDVRI